MKFFAQKISRYLINSIEDYSVRNKHWTLYRLCFRISGKWYK